MFYIGICVPRLRKTLKGCFQAEIRNRQVSNTIQEGYELSQILSGCVCVCVCVCARARSVKIIKIVTHSR